MKGLIQNTAGETIEFPILSCMKEGLTPIEYFHYDARFAKGLTDTALNTAKAGYLTSKLFVVAQDVMVAEEDCGTKEGIKISSEVRRPALTRTFRKNIRGRFLAADVIPKNGKDALQKGDLLFKLDGAQSTGNA